MGEERREGRERGRRIGVESVPKIRIGVEVTGPSKPMWPLTHEGPGWPYCRNRPVSSDC